MLRPSWPLLTEHQVDNESPSRKDGWTLKKEKAARKKAVTCIMEAGQELELPSPCVTHAVAMWQRYFTVRSLQNTDSFILACACLLTASKAEDVPKNLSDVAYVAYKTMWKNKPSLKAKLQDLAFFSHLKEAIIVAERALLYMLGFEFTMVNPQRVAIIMIQRYMPDLSTDTCQLVINVLNDQLKTTLMLQFPAKILAVAALKWILSFVKNKPGEYVDAELPSTPSEQPPAPKGKVLWWQHALADNAHADMLEACERSVRGMYSVATFGEAAEANGTTAADAGSGISGHTNAAPAAENSPNLTVQAASPAAVPTPSPSNTGPSPHPHKQEPSATPAGPADDTTKMEPADETFQVESARDPTVLAPAAAAAVAAPAEHGQSAAMTNDGDEHRQVNQTGSAAGPAVQSMGPAPNHASSSMPSHAVAAQHVREPGGFLATNQPQTSTQGQREQSARADAGAIPSHSQATMMPPPGSAAGDSSSYLAAAEHIETGTKSPGLPGTQPEPALPHQAAVVLERSQHGLSAVPGMPVVQNPAVLRGIPLVSGSVLPAQPHGPNHEQQPTAAPPSAMLASDPGALAQQPIPQAPQHQPPVSQAAANLWQEAKAATYGNPSGASPAGSSQAAGSHQNVPQLDRLSGIPPAGMLQADGLQQSHSDVPNSRIRPPGDSQQAAMHHSMSAEGVSQVHPSQSQVAAAAADSASDGLATDLHASSTAMPGLGAASQDRANGDALASPALPGFQHTATHPPAADAAPTADPLGRAPSTSPSRKRHAAEDGVAAGTAPGHADSKKKARLERLSKWKDAQAAKGSLPKPQGHSAPTTAGPSPSATMHPDPQGPPSSAQASLAHSSDTAADGAATHKDGFGKASSGLEKPPSALEDPSKPDSTTAPDERQHLHAVHNSSNTQEPAALAEGPAGSIQPRAAGHEPLAPVLVPTNAPAVPDHLPLDQFDRSNMATEPHASPGHPQQQSKGNQKQTGGNGQLPTEVLAPTGNVFGGAVLLGPPDNESSTSLMQGQPLQHAPIASEGQQGADAVKQEQRTDAAGLASISPSLPVESLPAAKRTHLPQDDASKQPKSAIGPDTSTQHDKQPPEASPEAAAELAGASTSAAGVEKPSVKAVGSTAAADHLVGSEAGAQLLKTIHGSDDMPSDDGGDWKAAAPEGPDSERAASASLPAAEPASALQPSSAAPAAAACPDAEPPAAVPTTSIKVADNATLKLTGTFKPGKLPHGHNPSEAAASRGAKDEKHGRQPRTQLHSTSSNDAAKLRGSRSNVSDSHPPANGRSRTARDIVREEELLPGPPSLTSLPSPDARPDSRHARTSSKPGQPHHNLSRRDSQRHSREDPLHEAASNEQHRGHASSQHGHGFADRHRSHSLGSDRESAPRQGKRPHREDQLASPRENGHGSHFSTESPSAKRPHSTPFSSQPHLPGSGPVHSSNQAAPNDRNRRRSSDLGSHGSGGQRARARDRSAVHGNDYYDDPEPGIGDDLYRHSASHQQSSQAPDQWHGQRAQCRQPPNDDRWGMEDGLPPHIDLERAPAGSASRSAPLPVQAATDAQPKKSARELSPGELSGSPSAGEGSPDAAGKRSVFSRISR
ncbi:hypothetical protein WJX74_003171 [Apatococcus lobatus]|uniref:Cyclin N-terminal domain-containing protein n=1 Tax=Apatococcus lobatus TaxID=904363 RepID=A0AAW1RWH3_9CHLO